MNPISFSVNGTLYSFVLDGCGRVLLIPEGSDSGALRAEAAKALIQAIQNSWNAVVGSAANAKYFCLLLSPLAHEFIASAAIKGMFREGDLTISFWGDDPVIKIDSSLGNEHWRIVPRK